MPKMALNRSQLRAISNYKSEAIYFRGIVQSQVVSDANPTIVGKVGSRDPQTGKVNVETMAGGSTQVKSIATSSVGEGSARTLPGGVLDAKP